MRKSLIVIAILVLVTPALGCNSSGSVRETYKAKGDISSVQTTGSEIEGIKSLYLVTLGDLQTGSQPDPKDHQALNVSGTKDTKIYTFRNGKKEKTDKESLRAGKKAEVIWSFANDHLTVINEITLLE